MAESASTSTEAEAGAEATGGPPGAATCPPGSNELAWLQEISTLTIAPPQGWPADEVTGARAAAGVLAACARGLLAEGTVDPVRCGRRCVACRGVGGTCDLVRDLAATQPDAVVSGSVSLFGFRAALLQACTAVFVCRRTLHPGDACLFSPPGDDDLCGRVLAAAHRLG